MVKIVADDAKPKLVTPCMIPMILKNYKAAPLSRASLRTSIY